MGERGSDGDSSRLSDSDGPAAPDAEEEEGASGTDEFLRRVARGRRDPAPLVVGPRTVKLGSERFVLGRRLGAGGFGTVYEAFDRRRNTQVALKTMNRHDPRTLDYFKREFRALAELTHPHLVQLYELHSDGDDWFFTMELLVGDDALAYVRKPTENAFTKVSLTVSPSGDAELQPIDSIAPARPTVGASVAAPPEGRPENTFDEIKLRALYRQLADGLCFLHDSGRLHRDVKPSNVMVGRDGRVVLLDFGLVADLSIDGGETADAITGTPAYMAPEQATGTAVGPAADWYAVGVMLYQALAGRLPFEATTAELLRRKRVEDPLPPSTWALGIPADLDRLCMDLLQRAPERRPSGGETRARLALEKGNLRDATEMTHATEEPVRRGAILIGRAGEQQALREAFAATRAGQTVVALLEGRSGMGKSALARRFLAELEESESNLVVLAGRCFEQESVPYKALDGLMDALSRMLRRMPRAEVEAILPRDADVLSRLFPVLRRVSAVEAGPRRPESTDKLDLRRRAFAALRELCARLGDRRRLVMFIDDLQWGDADSGMLLAELLRAPDAPVLLLVIAYRSDEVERSECLRALVPALRRATSSGLQVREVAIEQLSEKESHELALRWLSPHRSPELAAVIARESGGWPFFIRELARFSEASGRSAGEQLSLEGALAGRMAALSDDERRLLEVIAVAGRPIERSVAARSAELAGDEPAVLGVLRSQHLVRVRSGGDVIEPYHDRIRETVLAQLLPSTARRHHLRLAEALEAAGGADAETLSVHYLGAGEAARAADRSVVAADQAMEALGFDRAARLYRQALALLAANDPRRRGLDEKLGGALAAGGRGAEAAAAYLAAVDGARAEQSLELRRRAAEHYLTSGHTDAGLAVLRSVLGAVGLELPPTALAKLVRLLPLMLFLRLRGLGFRERPASEVPVEDLLRIDACAAAATGLTFADPLGAAYFQKRFLRLALRAGEPHRVLRALNFESTFAAALGRDVPSRYERNIERTALLLVEKLGDPGVQFQVGRGIVLAVRGRFREARAQLDAAEARLQENSVGLIRDRSLTRFFLIQSLFYLGEWKELRRRQSLLLADARTRGDLFLEVMLSSLTGHLPALMEDRPEAARAAVERAAALWERANHFQHYCRLLALAATELYREAGVGEGALQLVESEWPALRRTRLMEQSWLVRSQCFFLRGLAGLAAAAGTPSRRETLLRAVDRDARALARIGTRTAMASALCLRAGAAAGRDRPDQAIALLRDGEAALAALDLTLLAAAARRRRGELLGGEEGRRLVDGADAAMKAEDIRDPARMVSMALPGRWIAGA